MASQPPPGSTDRTPGPPRPQAPPSVPAASRRSYVRKCVVLVDWWLERVEGDEGKVCIAGFTETPQTRKGASSSKGNIKAAARVFKCAVAKRLDSTRLETVNGYLVRIGRILNISQMRANGFSQEVCESFEFGFPIEWEKLANQNMEQMNGRSHSPSKSTANAPSASVQYDMEKILSDSFINSSGYAFAGFDFNLSRRSTSNKDGPPPQRLSYLSNANTGNSGNSMSKMAASEGLGNGRLDVTEAPLPPPRETCSRGQEYDQHGSMQIDASEQAIVDCSISSALAKKRTICSYSKVDGNRPAPSKIASVEKEGHIKGVGCFQQEKDVDIQHANNHSCSSQQEKVTHPADSALFNNHMSHTSSDLGEGGSGTPKRGKTSVNLGTGDDLDVPTEGMTPLFGVVRASEDNTVRRLRSGKVFGVPSSAPVKKGNKRKRMQHEASNNKMVPI